jgi:Ni,Fe-hydrogenase III component G
MRTTEEILRIASQLTEEWLFETTTKKPEPNRLDVYVKHIEDLVPIAVGLRVQGLGYLAAITGMDYGPEAGKMEVLYHFCTGEATVTLRVDRPREDASVPTMTEIIPGAEAFERELSEMFGVTIDGLRNPLRLYLPDDMPEDIHPLRKDISEEEVAIRVEL